MDREAARDFLAVSSPRAWMTTRGCSRATPFAARPVGVGELGEGRGDCVGRQRTRGACPGVAHDLVQSGALPRSRPLRVRHSGGRARRCTTGYRVRIAEMRESHRIITQALEHLPEGDYKIPGLALHPAASRSDQAQHGRADLPFQVYHRGDPARPWARCIGPSRAPRGRSASTS